MRGALRKAVAERGKRAELDVRSKLLNLEGYIANLDPVVEKRRAALESRLDGIYRDQARTQLDFWKDQQTLRERLTELLGEFQQASSRDRLVKNFGYTGGQPE